MCEAWMMLRAKRQSERCILSSFFNLWLHLICSVVILCTFYRAHGVRQMLKMAGEQGAKQTNNMADTSWKGLGF